MTDAEWLTTTYTYDAFGRVIAETKSGGGIRPDMTISTTYAPEDRILSRTVTSGNLSGLLLSPLWGNCQFCFDLRCCWRVFRTWRL